MKLVVKQHRPIRRILLASCFVLGAAAAVATAFHYGHWRYIVDSMGSANSKRGLMEDNIELRNENDALNTRLARLNRGIEVDTEARREHLREISRLQSGIAQLKHELAFYRDIMASTQVGKGPQVRGFKVRDVGGSGRYQYRLVLTHVSKDDKVASGHVDVVLEGELNGKEYRVALGDIVESDAADLAFEFKHFRRIEGVFKIPSEFSPKQVHVQVRENGKRKSTFRETYKWARLVDNG